MNVDMEEEMIAYQLRKAEESKPSGLKWLLVIALGVFLGNSASFGLERAVLYWELKQVAIAATAAMEQTSRNMAATRKVQEARAMEQRKMMAAKAKQQKLELQQKQAGYRQAKETCDFWRQHLRTDNTAQNRMYRDQACRLVNQFR